MYLPEEDQTIQKFYTDAVNSAIFQTPVSYLQKYENIQNYSIIVETQQTLLKLLFQVVANGIEKTSKIAEYLTEHEVNERIVPFLSKIIVSKLPDISQTLIRREISRGSTCLLDNNWRIINIQTTNWNTHTNKIMLNLTLILQQTNNENPNRQLYLELNIHEAQSLLSKLKEIKRSLKV